jgi:hypothetical protein
MMDLEDLSVTAMERASATSAVLVTMVLVRREGSSSRTSISIHSSAAIEWLMWVLICSEVADAAFSGLINYPINIFLQRFLSAVLDVNKP